MTIIVLLAMSGLYLFGFLLDFSDLHYLYLGEIF